MGKIPGTIGAALVLVVIMATSAAPASADDCTWYPSRPDAVCKPSPDWGREAPGILKDVTADNTDVYAFWQS
jgi:hypothetical protein